MVFNKKEYYKNYYRKPENAEKNRAGMRLNYWRKKYCDEFGVNKEDTKDMTEQQMREAIGEGRKINLPI